MMETGFRRMSTVKIETLQPRWKTTCPTSRDVYFCSPVTGLLSATSHILAFGVYALVPATFFFLYFGTLPASGEGIISQVWHLARVSVGNLFWGFLIMALWSESSQHPSPREFAAQNDDSVNKSPQNLKRSRKIPKNIEQSRKTHSKNKNYQTQI